MPKLLPVHSAIKRYILVRKHRNNAVRRGKSAKTHVFGPDYTGIRWIRFKTVSGTKSLVDSVHKPGGFGSKTWWIQFINLVDSVQKHGGFGSNIILLNIIKSFILKKNACAKSLFFSLKVRMQFKFRI